MDQTHSNTETVLDSVGDLDKRVFRAVAEWHSPILDRTMPELSEIASQSRLWMGIAALFAVFGGGKGRRTAVEGMVAIGVNSFLANLVFKNIAHRKRPTESVPDARKLTQPESTSFPSGHTASAAAFSGIVDRAYPKLWLPINGLAATVGFSRVYTGVHYPGDVLAGWFLGKAVALVVSYVSRRLGFAPDSVD
ncbi:MAG: phosphatase PAP2 family protein [Actinomycetia bacterium]|nr:phosphatase PAP2 family protein [Actinomycetes bacterium]